MKYEIMIESYKQVFVEDVEKALEALLGVLLRVKVEVLYFREVKP